MKKVVAFVLALVGCQSGQPPSAHEQSPPPTASQPPTEPRGRFFAQGATGDEHPLDLRTFTATVTTQPGTVHTHLKMEVATAAEGLTEAIIRLPVPRWASITDAVLWMNDRPMRGAFVERQRAQQIYTSIVTRRRDPALVTWDGPGWIAVSIFPLEKGRPRRFELDWVEPASTARAA